MENRSSNGINGSSSCCSNRQYEANPMPAFLADSIKEYVRLIEGQMNNDELFCYFINQLDYYETILMKRRNCSGISILNRYVILQGDM